VSGARLSTRDGITPFTVTAQAVLGKVVNMILDKSKDKQYPEVIDALEDFRGKYARLCFYVTTALILIIDALIVAKNIETEVEGDTRYHNVESTDSVSDGSEVSYDAKIGDSAERKASQKNDESKGKVKRKRLLEASDYTKKQKHE
jgi:hypothetical protein